MDKALQFPGVSNAWTMPIKARIDMLATGIRTPVGVKVFGTRPRPRSSGWRARSRRRCARCRAPPAPSPSASSAAIISTSSPTATQLARYGLMVGDVQDVIATALGAETVTTTVEGRERYAVNVRYPRDLRIRPAGDRPRGAGLRCRTAAPSRSARSPSIELVRRGRHRSAPRTRSSRPTSMSTCATATSAAMSPTRKARRRRRRSSFRPATYVTWSGQFEYYERAKARLQIVVPATLPIIFLLLYLNFRRMTETLIVMLSLPFALVGGLWLMWWLGFNLSVAVAVGFIALAGVAAETGVVMLIYLDQALTERRESARAAGRAVHARRSPRGHHGRRGRARAAEDDDGRRHHGGPAADPVEHAAPARRSCSASPCR